MRPQRLDTADLSPFLDRGRSPDAAVVATARQIMADVAARGDAAVHDWNRRLDGQSASALLTGPDDWPTGCPDDIAAALRANAGRIEAFHAAQVGQDIEMQIDGITLGRRAVALQSVACYVPGGRAAYPSTVLMTVIPARLAGVERIVVVTPRLDAVVAEACRIAGATHVLHAGGAQAIAAAAYGVDALSPVDVIVGPGNAYVTAAKAEAAAMGIRTDAPAGPSELLVLADGTADPEPIAWDMQAQAEHDPDAQVILVTDDDALASAVGGLLDELAPQQRRADIILASLARGAILVGDWDEAIEFANAYAPEHVELHCAEPRKVLARLRNAGSVFLGPWAPVSAGDYGSGTNHVLPTMGQARFRGGLAVDDFCKWITWQDMDAAALAPPGDDIVAVAEAEGLHAHAAAVTRRLA